MYGHPEEVAWLSLEMVLWSLYKYPHDILLIFPVSQITWLLQACEKSSPVSTHLWVLFNYKFSQKVYLYIPSLS